MKATTEIQPSKNLRSPSSIPTTLARRPLLWAATVALSLIALRETHAAHSGGLDLTFGVGGKVQTVFGVNSSYGRDITLQSDGKMVVVGFSGVYPGSNSAIARYNIDGSLDMTFGDNGTVISHFSVTDSFNAVAVQPDGKIVAAGSAAATSGNNGTDVLVARYKSDGTLDATFGVNGAVITKLRGADIPKSYFFSASAQDVTLLSDGRIVVAGQTTTVAFGRMALLRYNSDGALDQTFADAGKAIVEFPVGPNGVNGGVSATALAVQADGKVVLAGSYVDNGFTEFALARANSDGSADTTFGRHGQVVTSLGSGDAAALDVLIQTDGQIVAGGYFEAGLKNGDFALARYNTHGSLDSSFGRSGVITSDLANGTDDVITGLALQADNRIIAAGQSGQYPAFDFGLARYTPTGRLDKTFGRKGVVTTDFGGSSFDIAYGVVLTADGRIVAAGETNAGQPAFDFALTRYLP